MVPATDTVTDIREQHITHLTGTENEIYAATQEIIQPID